MRRKTAFHPIAHLPSFWQIFFLLHVVTNFLLSVDLVPGLGRGSEHFFFAHPPVVSSCFIFSSKLFGAGTFTL